MNGAPTITTDSIVLCPLSMAHWDDYAAMWADPRMTQFIGGKPRSRNESWYKFCASAGLWNMLGYGYWAFTDKESGALLGVGGLSQWERGIDGLEGFPEAGWAFAPDAWGRGLATQAMRAVLSWADEVLEKPEIRCIIDPENTASLRVAEKLGFAEMDRIDDKIGPVVLMQRPTS